MHVPVPVSQYSARIEYNAECTAHFRILNNELLNKDPDVVPEQAHIIILDIKSAI